MRIIYGDLLNHGMIEGDERMKTILVIDGQGGRIGKLLIKSRYKLRTAFKKVCARLFLFNEQRAATAEHMKQVRQNVFNPDN